MKTFIQALLVMFVTAIILCGIYPLFIYSMGQLFFPHQANGSLIYTRDGKILGSELIGQKFSDAKYFHPRPGNYDGANSGGTNLGPTSQKLADAVKIATEKYRAKNNLTPDTPVPADAVTTSGSGLDPHISMQNANLQIARVARERGLDFARVAVLVKQCTDNSGVNVLKLNLALDYE